MKAAEEYHIRLTSVPRWYFCESWWRWEPPALSDYDLWYVRGGKGRLRTQYGDWEVGANTCFVLRPGSKILGTLDPENPLVVFAVHFEWLDAAYGDAIQGSAAPPFTFPDSPLPGHDWSRLDAMSMEAERAFNRNDPVGRVQSTAWVRQMLLHLITELTLPPANPVDIAIEEIMAGCRQSPGQWRTVKEMAEQAHLSPSQFTRRFRTFAGLPPQTYVIRTRLDRAKQMLEESNMTQEHIAHALGYANLFFFSKQYKEWMGETPSATRKRVRGR
jgi:AraC-like DNA-binding protein